MTLRGRIRETDYGHLFESMYTLFRNDISDFAMWNCPYHTDHGLGHVKRVIEYLDKLTHSYQRRMNPLEIFVLLSSVVFHDVGLMLNRLDGKHLTRFEIRDKHHILSKRFVQEDLPLFKVFDKHITDCIGDVILCHTRKVKIEDVFKSPTVTLLGSPIRPRWLAALLRLADALDCDSRRAPEVVFKNIVKYYPDSVHHWKACQLISGVDIDEQQGSIVIDAKYSNEEERDLLIWKASDVFNELVSVETILLSSDGPRLWDVLLRATHSGTKELLPINIKEHLENESRVQQINEQERQQFLIRLSKIWRKARFSEQRRIEQSATLYAEYNNLPFSRQETMQLIYTKWLCLVSYLDNKGRCKVEYYVDAVNISNSPIESCTHPMGGVTPMTSRKAAVKCCDMTQEEQCEVKFIEDTPFFKRIRYSFKPMSTGEKRKFYITHLWDYPLPLFGLRSNKVVIGLEWFNVDYECRFIFPSGSQLGQTKVFRDEHLKVVEEPGITKIDVPSPTLIFKKTLPFVGSCYNIHIWLKRKQSRVSRKEVEHDGQRASRRSIKMTDQGRGRIRA